MEKFNLEKVKEQELNQKEKQDILLESNEILKTGNNVAKTTINEISLDIEKAKVLQKQLGEQADPILEQMENLKEKAQIEKAAFNARIERLNTPYVLSPELEKIIQVAKILNRPILLEGEPGTGKTSLAYALAGHEDLPIIHAQCKSTTTAQELLYTFDVIQRLQDAQLGKDVSDPRKYVKLGPLGQAFSSQEPVILLIDEIDKAKRDFSNDLLHELDQMSFFITETGEEIAAKYKPIVIITSNHERDLPEPVLRRVLYSYIEFPDPEQMTEIVKAHVPDVSEKLLKSAIKRFYEIRENENLEKKPSTSEMLDWIKVLQKFGIDKIETDIIFPETLLKNKKDIDTISAGIENIEELKNKSEAILAVINGEKVVKIKKNNDYYYLIPDESLYTILANEGYQFTTGDYNHRFAIHAEGVRCIYDQDNTKSLILSFSPLDKNNPYKNNLYLYELLKEKGLIESELIITDKPINFVEVEYSNALYTKGKDENGNTIYRTKDNKFIFEQNLLS